MQISSLSAADIKRSVLLDTLQRPLALYPVVIAILGLFYCLMIEPLAMLWALAGFAFTLAIVYWLIAYFIRGQSFALNAVAAFHQDIVSQREAAISKLQQQLAEFEQAQGAAQVQQLKQKFDAFQDVLNLKLNQQELAYARYLTMAEQVFLAAVDNLNDAVSSLKGIAAIDEKRLKQQLKALGKTPLEQEQKAALEERLKLFHDTQQRVVSLFTDNEKAMTQLDKVSSQLARISTKQGHANMELEHAMAEMRILAQRAKKYHQP